MLSNAYFLAKFGFDTAENEPCPFAGAELRRPRRKKAAPMRSSERGARPHFFGSPGLLNWSVYDSMGRGVVSQATNQPTEYPLFPPMFETSLKWS